MMFALSAFGLLEGVYTLCLRVLRAAFRVLIWVFGMNLREFCVWGLPLRARRILFWPIGLCPT
jgi:hypothetical protein